MANSFTTPDGDLENLYITDYALIDRYSTTGSLWVWGNNNQGQLATNNAINYSSPVQTVSGGTNWKQIAASSSTSGAIKTDGTLWMWGNNGYGQVGDNTSATTYSSPVQTISGGTNWKQIVCGQNHTAAIKTDGTLWTWGQNTSGQLGTNNITNYSSPIQTVSGGNNWRQVSAGQNHLVAIKTDGTLWAWGLNNSGQLGINNVASRSSPVQTIAGGTNWKTLFDGYCATSRTAAIKTDGTLWVWGLNTSGALGTNDITNYSSPVQTVAAGTNWKSVSVSLSNITCAIKTDGTLWTWGANGLGGLGTGDTIGQSSPVQTIAGGTNWKQCVTSGSAAYGTVLAVKTDGTLWSWGASSIYGVGGRNNLTNISSPAQTIAGGTNWKSITMGTLSVYGIYFYDAGNLYPSS
jgi:alpha-tubulin suppressor-like RCC1 family protein